MQAGRRRVPVTIEQFGSTGTDPVYNTPTNPVWTTWRTPMAEVVPKRGGESVDGGQRFSETFFRFSFNFDDVDGIDVKMRLSFEGRIFDIQNVMPDYTLRKVTLVDATAQDGGS